MNLCSNPDDKLQIYRDNFEKAYMDSTERFYRTQAPAYLQQNGVQNYMKYVSVQCDVIWSQSVATHLLLWSRTMRELMAQSSSVMKRRI